MAYSELIKDFERIRDYMREFYIYGFRQRGEYDAKSARSYDNERRRIESWLGDYMSFRQDSNGKKVFLSVDSRTIVSNPLYRAFKAKSFTENDITLHFYILDILADGDKLSVRGIVESMANDYFSKFDAPPAIDESTVRKKLKEYEQLGILKSEKCGRELFYYRVSDAIDLPSWKDAISFFSEANQLGVIGSYLLDKIPDAPQYFGFKHHYILHALDSQILCSLFEVMTDKRCAEITVKNRRTDEVRYHTVLPAKIFVSTQTGRQYLLAYHYRFHKPIFYRIDSVRAVKAGAMEKKHDKYLGYCEKFSENLWGVSAGVECSLDHIEMTVAVDADEPYIIERLNREKRCGKVEMIDEKTYLFSADVYDAAEMLPWLRTFIGRIKKLECTNSYVTETFNNDLAAMRQLYGGDSDAVL